MTIEGKRYRVRCTYRQWIGKPDPSGFGRFEIHSNDRGWLQREAERRRAAGHRVGKVEDRHAVGTI